MTGAHPSPLLQGLAKSDVLAFYRADCRSSDIYIAGRLARKLGLCAAERIDNTEKLSARIHPDDRALFADALFGACPRAAVGPRDIRFRIHTQNEGLVWLRGFLVMPRVRGTTAALCLAHLTDRSEAASLSRELAAAREECGRYVQQAHHDIGNQLQSLVVMLRSYSGIHPVSDHAIDSVIARVVSLSVVQSLLMSRSPQPLDLRDLFQRLSRALADASHVPLRLHSRETRRPLATASHHEALVFSVVVGELLANAIRHTPPQPQAAIDVAIEATEHRIELCIANGPARSAEPVDPDARFANSRGLALVQSLLPIIHSQLEIREKDDRVVCRLVVDSSRLNSRAQSAAPGGSGRSA